MVLRDRSTRQLSKLKQVALCLQRSRPSDASPGSRLDLRIRSCIRRMPGLSPWMILFLSASAWGTDSNNGTDPTKLTSSAAIVYEYNDLLPNLSRHAPRFDLILPFGEKKDYSLRLRVPVISNDIADDNDFGLGDVSIMGTHVFGLTQKRGLVAQAELVFDSASRAELGTGKHVLKATFIYARFLPKGIFAPAVVHSASIGGDGNRATVNSTTFDFYYVPKVSDPRTFVTLDPSITSDWETNKQFISIATTVGRAVGPAFGGSAQIFIKPSVLIGADRPGDWGIEVGYKVLGF